MSVPAERGNRINLVPPFDVRTTRRQAGSPRRLGCLPSSAQLKRGQASPHPPNLPISNIWVDVPHPALLRPIQPLCPPARTWAARCVAEGRTLRAHPPARPTAQPPSNHLLAHPQHTAYPPILTPPHPPCSGSQLLRGRHAGAARRHDCDGRTGADSVKWCWLPSAGEGGERGSTSPTCVTLWTIRNEMVMAEA